MTDIVERLRIAAPLPTGLYCEAADVIERQRQQLFEEHEAHLIAEQRWIMKLGGYKVALEQVEKELAASGDREMAYIAEIKGMDNELAESKANDLFAMRLLAESQARIQELRRFVEASTEYALGNPAFERVCRSSDDTALKAALAAERERCAKVCEARPAYAQLAHDCADAIRALGEEI